MTLGTKTSNHKRYTIVKIYRLISNRGRRIKR